MTEYKKVSNNFKCYDEEEEKYKVIIFEEEINTCPYCESHITPDYNFGSFKDSFLKMNFKCPNSKCSNNIQINYTINSEYEYNKYVRRAKIDKILADKLIEIQEFPDSIMEVSDNFINIYNQSCEAENNKLDQISGIGYRKAFEFLIKDYLISKLEKEDYEEIENIKKMPLGQCISNKIESHNIKELAKRTNWLGNDETHYVRKWENKNIEDLKKMIKITTHWIEQDYQTQKIINEMN